MCERWRFNRFNHRMATVVATLLVFHQSLSLCSSLSAEGRALLEFRQRLVSDPFGALSNWNDGVDHCSWFGVECFDGKVISLNLKDLCIEGTLAPQLGKLTYIKSIILRNNSFSGNIPGEVAELKELEVLNLGYNNFNGPFPSDIGNNISLSILLLDHNELLGSITPEQHRLMMLSEFQVDENQLTSAALGDSCNSRSSAWHPARIRDDVQRRLLQVLDPSNTAIPPPPPPSPSNSVIQPNPPTPRPPLLSPPPPVPLPSPSPSPYSSLSPTPAISSPSDPPVSPFPSSPPSVSPSLSFSPSRSPPSLAPTTLPDPHTDPTPPAYLPSLASTPVQSEEQNSKSSKSEVVKWSVVAAGGSALLIFSVVCVLLCRSSKIVTVKPWVTGLSGQLQKAFVTGVPKLQRSELVTACEDFSNIIGCLSDGKVYKGTLSSGVEIAVASTAVKSAEDWSRKLEVQFRKKIETLSRVNHKNFVNLIGFCEEEQPFTRMMVFEYAPNGTLFEHLHVMEAEHLDWTMRLRVAMGIAYCLEHIHQLTPPVAHANLVSSSIYLTEDYAAKISDYSFWNEATATIMGSAATGLLGSPVSDPESNVYSFGVILIELITGKIPRSVGNVPLVAWASDYMAGQKPFREMVDPTLSTFQEEVLEKIFEVIKDCVHFDQKQRPTMKDVTSRLKEITAMGPDGATPRSSPLWWAELEILSSETS